MRGALKAKREEAERKNREFETLAGCSVVSAISAVVDLRKGRLPRDLILPSDVRRAWNAYDTARLEGDAWIEERRRVEASVDRLSQSLTGTAMEMRKAGCGD